MKTIFHFRTAGDLIFDFVYMTRKNGGYPLLETAWHSFIFDSAPRPNDVDDWVAE